MRTFPDEEHFGAAALRHYSLACQLAQHPEFLSEARFHALMSVECCLKEWFCLLRFRQHGHPARDGNYATFRKARDFSHGLVDLVNAVMSDFPRSKRPLLGRLLAELPKSAAWNEERYGAALGSETEAWKSTLKVLDLAKPLFGLSHPSSLKGDLP